jgi:hypothetical protein
MAIRTELARREIHPARLDDIVQARDMAAKRIGAGIAQADVLMTVHERSGLSLFTTRDRDGVTGALAIVPLSVSGLFAIENNGFDSLAPDLGHVAAAGDDPVAIYIWGVAAIRKMAGGWLSNGLAALFETATPRLPYFATPATSAGAHLLQRTGFRPFPGSADGLMRRPPTLAPLAASPPAAAPGPRVAA